VRQSREGRCARGVLTAQSRGQDTPARAAHAATQGAGRRSAAGPKQGGGGGGAGGKQERAGGKAGYCALCKVKHDNAKKHADSRAHRQLVTNLLTQRQQARSQQGGGEKKELYYDFQSVT